MGLAILFCFFVFSKFFWVLDQKYQKPRENQKNKKNKIADPNSPACTYKGLAILFFLFFLVFSKFFGVLTKSIKNLEKPKKPTKNKIADPNSPACTYMGLAFFCFFVFSKFFWFFDQKYQKPRQNPKTRPPLSLQYHCFLVARNFMRIIINNEISLIIIFRYCCNHIDIFDVSQKHHFFEKITIFLTRIIIFSNIFLIVLILGRNISNFCAKISSNISLFLGQNII